MLCSRRLAFTVVLFRIFILISRFFYFLMLHDCFLSVGFHDLHSLDFILVFNGYCFFAVFAPRAGILCHEHLVSLCKTGSDYLVYNNPGVSTKMIFFPDRNDVVRSLSADRNVLISNRNDFHLTSDDSFKMVSLKRTPADVEPVLAE